MLETLLTTSAVHKLPTIKGYTDKKRNVQMDKVTRQLMYDKAVMVRN